MRRPTNRTTRDASVIVPEYMDFPYQLELPEDEDIPVELPDPHLFRSRGLVSYRATHRAHHRIDIAPVRNVRYVRRKVKIPLGRRDFSPFASSWRYRNGVWSITHHFRPDMKLDYWMNKRQMDWKHSTRSEPDDSRANALNLISYRNSSYRHGMFGALSSNDPGIAGDTAIALYNRIRRG